MATAQSNIGTLQTDMSTANGNITTLQGKVTTAENDIDTLEANTAYDRLFLSPSNSTWTTNTGSVNSSTRFLANVMGDKILAVTELRVMLSGVSSSYRPNITIKSDELKKYWHFSGSCSTVAGPSSAPGTQYVVDNGSISHVAYTDTMTIMLNSYAGSPRSGYFQFTI